MAGKTTKAELQKENEELKAKVQTTRDRLVSAATRLESVGGLVDTMKRDIRHTLYPEPSTFEGDDITNT